MDYYTNKKGIAGLGPLNLESRWGLYLRPTLAIIRERVPRGCNSREAGDIVFKVTLLLHRPGADPPA